jgi:hypothetical protein
MRIEGKHVEGRAQELEDGYRKEGDIGRWHREVPVEAVQVPSHSWNGNVCVASVREELEGHRRQNLQIFAQQSALTLTPQESVRIRSQRSS